MKDRNSLIGFVLIFLVIAGWTYFTMPDAAERAAAQRKADSTQAAERLLKHREDSAEFVRQENQAATEQKQSTAVDIDSTLNPAQNDSLQYANQKAKAGDFANASVGEDKDYILENEKLKLTISRKGGRITSAQLKEFRTYDSLDLVLFVKEQSNFGFSFYNGNLALNTAEMYFDAVYKGENAPEQIVLENQDSLQFSMRMYADLPNGEKNPDAYIEYLYTLNADDYMVDFDIRFVNVNSYLRDNFGYSLKWNADLRLQEKAKSRINGSTVYYKINNEDTDYLSETKDDKEEDLYDIKWVSFKQQFFSTSLIAKDKFKSAKIEANEEENREPKYVRTMAASMEVPFDALEKNNDFSMQWYFGPNKYKTLKSYELDLERQIPLGWGFFLLQWINRGPVLWVFNWLESYNFSYGLIIFLLTVMLKLVLFPIAYKTYLSSARMRVLKPEVDKINERFPKQEDAMKKQQETMKLYKQAGVNPMAGCVPMLLQFPILIALFRFFPAAFELRQESFLWADDLSTYDSILDLGFNIPFYGDHVSLFTLLMTVSTLLYTFMNNQMMQSNQTMPGMKTMMYIMPVMFLGIFNSYAAGLSYYYFLANMITFFQMFFIRRMIDEDKLRAKIKENQKKPVKKSNFQKRLEDMAKQRGVNPAQGGKKR